MSQLAKRLLPSTKARWIWDESDRLGYHYYLEARRTFSIARPQAATLLITADAYYQVTLNGHCLGQGPAKSAEGKRSVDCYDLEPYLIAGENVLDVLVLSAGTGSMTYLLGEAGLLYEARLISKTIYSDAQTQVRRCAARLRPTTRRWILPCIEDVDSAARPGPWRPAKIVTKAATLYPRRVPLPRREAVYPSRIMRVDRVKLPNFSVTFRIKPALVSAEENKRWNHYSTAANVRIPIHSPKPQTLTFTPTLGVMKWFFQGKELYKGEAGNLTPKRDTITIRLQAGHNELVGRHEEINHFENINLAGFVETPVRVGTMKIERDDGQNFDVVPMPFANAHDLAVGAVVAADAPVRRTILDLGCVQNGWISFEARGQKGSAVMFAFCEWMESGAGKAIQWAEACNNALTYRLRDGWQKFESFFPYGVRYVVVHEVGGTVELRNLHLLKATCTQKPSGHFQTDDLLFNGIYRICVQSIESGTDDTFTDCPTFEQVNWNYDNRLASTADFLTTGNYDIIRNSILLFAEDPEYSGMVASQTPSAWSKRIPLWSFHWIYWCWDYYWYTGDAAFIRKVFPRIKAGIREALGKIGSQGLMEFSGAWHMVDWAHGRDDDHAINTAEQAAMVEALSVADKLARVMGRPAEFAQTRAKLVRSINRHLWNPGRKYYADSLHENGKLSPVSSQCTNAIMALYGGAKADWARGLALDLAQDKSSLLPSQSPMGFYYLFELMDRFGHGDAILKGVGRRWGDILREGDGTTWEMFADYGHGAWSTRSRCHPMGAYVVKYLVKYVLGIESLAPGFSKVRVQPHPPAHMKKGDGAIPTPHGPLRVSWSRHRSGLKCEIDAPKGVTVV